MNSWKPLPDEWNERCMVCGSEPETKTSREDLLLLCEDDEIRCSNPECHTQAQIILSDGESDYIADFHWMEETSKKFKNKT